jgi:hypothetical protein
MSAKRHDGHRDAGKGCVQFSSQPFMECQYPTCARRLDMVGAGIDIDDPAAPGTHVDVVFDNNCVARGSGPLTTIKVLQKPFDVEWIKARWQPLERIDKKHISGEKIRPGR